MKLNPKKTEIIGYETPACLELLISLMVGMIEEDSIPSVRLYTFDSGKSYQICYPDRENLDGADAGHHRTLAAYLLGECLDVRVVESIVSVYGYPIIKMEIPEQDKISISQIRIESNPTTFDFEKNGICKYYRDLPNVDEFFSRYEKINLALKYGTHIDYSLDDVFYAALLDKIKQF
ncbi:MAG: hypothetical protein ABIG89_06575 [Candidatus Woesearchaeota archaeon]